MEQYADVQQLMKKEDGQNRKPIYPPTVIQAVFDGKKGASLEAVLAQFNSIYVQYQGTPKDTRLIIPMEMRRAGLTITYMDMDSNTITERANSAVQKDNDHWALDVNWSRVDELSLSGDISVSAKGTWIINGKDTGIKAVGPKGDTGLTPWLKTIDNKLHFSYDNVTWEPCSENIAAWFRFNATSSDSQAGTIGRIQISRDNKTWTDLSPEFRNDLRIQGYVATTSALPANQVVGTIYGVGPTYAADDTAQTNPIYRLHVWNGTSWVDNGQFTSIAAGVVQETGDSESEVMSQKAVSTKLSELGSNQGNIKLIGEGDKLVKLYFNLIAGHIYRIYFINPNWEFSGVIGGAKLYFAHRTLSNDLVYDINIPYGGNVESCYTIIAEESLNNNRYTMSLRANEGQEIYLKVLDVTNDVLYQEGIRLEGNGDNLVRTKLALQAGHVYKLYIPKVWSYSGSKAKLYVSHRTTSNVLIEDYVLTDVSYAYSIFAEETIDGVYTISIRADIGEVANLRIEDITKVDDYKEINMVAGYFGITGYIKGALHYESAALDFFRSYYNVKYYKTNGRCLFHGVKGLEKDQKLYIYSYDSNFIFKTKIEYTEDVIVNAEYVRFAVVSENTKDYTDLCINIGVIAPEFTEIKEGYREDNIAGESIRYFSFEINTPQSDNAKGSGFVGNKTDRNFTNGYILLPKNYTREGKPCKLAINCHGTSGYPFELNNLDDERVKWLAAAGYAVIDCSPYGWQNYKDNPGNYDGNMPNALAITCYTSLYKWVVDNYNVEKEVYVYGKSAGGLLATTFGSLNTFPIKAIASIAGSVSSVVNMMCVANTRNNNFLREVGCENPNVSTHLGSTIKGEPCSVYDRNYVIENYELIKDYDPLLYHLIGVDKVKMLSRMMEIGFNHFSEDSELNDIISNGYKVYHYPIKIWHAIDDENVPFATSRWYQQLISNAGGMCFLREFPENTGNHYIDAPSHEEEGVVPTVEYTTLLGESITMSVVYAEMIDWFNRW